MPAELVRRTTALSIRHIFTVMLQVHFALAHCLFLFPLFLPLRFLSTLCKRLFSRVENIIYLPGEDRILFSFLLLVMAYGIICLAFLYSSLLLACFEGLFSAFGSMMCVQYGTCTVVWMRRQFPLTICRLCLWKTRRRRDETR